MGTPWRIILLNVANIGVVYVTFTYGCTLAVFPSSDLLIAIPIAAVLALFFDLLNGLFAAIMPHTGSEYVSSTGTLHPVWFMSASR